jgi:hypothetical protein
VKLSYHSTDYRGEPGKRLDSFPATPPVPSDGSPVKSTRYDISHCASTERIMASNSEGLEGLCSRSVFSPFIPSSSKARCSPSRRRCWRRH